MLSVSAVYFSASWRGLKEQRDNSPFRFSRGTVVSLNNELKESGNHLTEASLKPKGLENYHQAPLEIAGVQGQTHRKNPVKEHGAGIKEGDKRDVLKHCSRIRQLAGLRDSWGELVGHSRTQLY